MSESLGLDTVVINLRRPGTDLFDVVTVHGSDEVRDALLNTVNGWEEWAAPRRALPPPWRVPHPSRRVRLDSLEGTASSSVPRTGEDPWLWHPEDELFVPFYASDGTLLGIFSVGEPRSGRRPSDEELDVLVAMAEHAAARSRRSKSRPSALVGAKAAGERPQRVLDRERIALRDERRVAELAHASGSTPRTLPVTSTIASSGRTLAGVPRPRRRSRRASRHR